MIALLLVIAIVFPQFSDADRSMADCIKYRESRNNPLAVGALGERGLYQIHPIHAWRFKNYEGYLSTPSGVPVSVSGWDTAFIPAINEAVAVELHSEYGWAPWVSTSGGCGV